MTPIDGLAPASDESLGFVHRFVPRTDEASRATVLLLHGTGDDENNLLSFGEAIAPGAALLSPRGNVKENGAPRFFRRIAEGGFDPVEVEARARELAAFVRAAVAAYRLDPGQLFALGYSNGANIASAVMFLDPSIFKGAMLLRPMVVFEPESKADLTGRSVFIGAGRMDQIIPQEQPGRLRKLFEERGASVTLCWQVSGHNLTPADIGEAARWFQVQSGSAAASFSFPK